MWAAAKKKFCGEITEFCGERVRGERERALLGIIQNGGSRAAPAHGL
jgi:hypothetical protein